MPALLNRARMSIATTGTGTVTLGSAITGFLSLAEAGAGDATAYPYVIEDGDDFEIGIGTYTSSGTTFSRDTVTASKISGTAGTSKINLSGSATIFITVRAGDIAPPSSADKYWYTSAANTWAEGSITTAGRALIDDADAAAQRTTLGLGTLATQSGTFSGTSSGTNTGDQTVREVLTANRTYYVRANLGTVTMTIASPAVATLTSHGLSADDPIIFSTSGALPTGVTAGTTYYVLSTDLSTNTFKFSTSAGGAAVNTSGTQSGTHTLATGNNSNNGLAQTRAGAFLTIQKALDVVATIDFGGYTVTIQLGDGTYSPTTETTVPVTVGQTTADKFVIQGNATTPENVVLNTPTAWNAAITAGTGARVTVKNLKVTGSTNTDGLSAKYGGELKYQNINYGAVGRSHLYAYGGGVITQGGAYTISGNAALHFMADLGGQIFVLSSTITLSGTPAFSNTFAYASGSGSTIVSQAAFSGSVTGKRYDSTANALIQTYGGGANYFPGNSAGTTATGGLYQ